MQISINANRCEPSPMRKFHPLAVKAKKEGKKIYHLNIGQPDLPTPKEFYEAVRQFDCPTLEYEASPGMPVLIEAIRNYYGKLGVELEPEDILITSGGSEALLMTCLCILDPYTEVIIPDELMPPQNNPTASGTTSGITHGSSALERLEQITYVETGRNYHMGIGYGGLTWILIAVLVGTTVLVGGIMLMWNKSRKARMKYSKEQKTN